MTESFHAFSRARNFRGMGRLGDSRLTLRTLSLLALLAFAMSAAATGNKDPTLRSSTAASRTIQLTRSRRPESSKGRPDLSVNTKTKATDLDSRLKQLENTTSKTTNGKRADVRPVNRVEATPASTTGGDRIKFQQQTQKRNGMSNQLGAGSGSRRYGPGRRITEHAH